MNLDSAKRWNALQQRVSSAPKGSINLTELHREIGELLDDTWSYPEGHSSVLSCTEWVLSGRPLDVDAIAAAEEAHKAGVQDALAKWRKEAEALEPQKRIEDALAKLAADNPLDVRRVECYSEFGESGWAGAGPDSYSSGVEYTPVSEAGTIALEAVRAGADPTEAMREAHARIEAAEDQKDAVRAAELAAIEEKRKASKAVVNRLCAIRSEVYEVRTAAEAARLIEAIEAVETVDDTSACCKEYDLDLARAAHDRLVMAESKRDAHPAPTEQRQPPTPTTPPAPARPAFGGGAFDCL